MTKKDKQSGENSEQIRQFLRKYELKKLTYSEIIQIYRNNVLEPQFRNTLNSAFFLIFAPALTNIYYTFRYQSVFSRVMPFVMPVVAVTQYALVLRNDLEQFCYQQTDDAQKMRKKYHILSHYQTKNNRLIQITESFHQSTANKSLNSSGQAAKDLQK